MRRARPTKKATRKQAKGRGKGASATKKASKKTMQKRASASRSSGAKRGGPKRGAKATAKRATGKKAPARKAAKKAPARKTAKKAPARKAAKKALARKAAKKAPARKAAKKAPARQAAKKAPARQAAKMAPARQAASQPPEAHKKRAAAKPARPTKELSAAPPRKTPSKPGAKAPASKTATAQAKAKAAPPSRPPTAPASTPPPPSEPPESNGRGTVAWAEAHDTAGEAPPSGTPKVELAPRRHVTVAPTIPIPVKAVPRRPTLHQRAKRLDQRLARQGPDFLDKYNENFEMSWIYHDTALEGVVYTFEELTTAFRSDEVTVVDSSVMPIYDAIRRNKEAIAFVKQAAGKKRAPVNVELLKALYTILHPEEGDPRSVRYRRDIPQHRLYFHEYASPDRIAYRVRQVIEWVNQPDTRKNVGTLRMAAKAHYDLARTYPFPSDSGKVARLFMNLLLIRGGLPPAIIHATERQRYYESLKSPQPTLFVQMLRDSVENSMASIEKLLDEHETRTRGFIN